MPAFRPPAPRSRNCFFIVLCAGALNAQTCLTVSRPEITSAGTAVMNLSLHVSAESALAAVQWTLEYSPSAFSNLSVDDGPALTTAGKTAICNVDRMAYQCLAVGANTNTIGTGVVARVTAVLVPGTLNPTVSIRSAWGATPGGDFVAIADCTLVRLRRRTQDKN